MRTFEYVHRLKVGVVCTRAFVTNMTGSSCFVLLMARHTFDMMNRLRTIMGEKSAEEGAADRKRMNAMAK